MVAAKANKQSARSYAVDNPDVLPRPRVIGIMAKDAAAFRLGSRPDDYRLFFYAATHVSTSLNFSKVKHNELHLDPGNALIANLISFDAIKEALPGPNSVR